MARWVQINRNGFVRMHETDRSDNKSVRAMAIHDEFLYAATFNQDSGAEIWRAPAYEPEWRYRLREERDGLSGLWRNVTPDWGEDITEVLSMTVFNNELYVGTAGSEIWKTGRGLHWSQVTPDTPGWTHNGGISSMIVKGDILYVAKSGPAQIWRKGSGDWEVLVSDGFGDPDNNDDVVFTVFEDTLYAGTGYERGAGGDGCQIWYYSDARDEWTRLDLPGGDGFGDANNVSVLSLAAFQGFLYVGTLNHNGAQVWRYQRHEGGDEWRDVTPYQWRTGDYDPFKYPRAQSFGVLPGLGIVPSGLYAGEGNVLPVGVGARVLVTAGGTETLHWRFANEEGFGDSDNRSIDVLLGSFLFVFASTRNERSGAEIWRLEPDFDRFRRGETPEPAESSISLILEAALNAVPDGRPLVSWTEARRMLRNAAGWDLDPDENFDAITKKRNPKKK